jgi:hypothetical protein
MPSINNNLIHSIKIIHAQSSFFLQYSLTGETHTLIPISAKSAFQLSVKYQKPWAHFIPLVELADGLVRVDQRWF